MRREGYIPAVLYGQTQENISVKLEKKLFEKILRDVPQGALSTVSFQLKLENKTYKAFVRDIAYQRVNYTVEHIDFMVVEDNQVISIYIPVVLKNADECKGISQGGQLKKVKRSVKVSCKASEVPKFFELDVKNIDLGQQLRVSDVKLTSSMKLRIHEKQVLVAVTK